MSFIRLQEFYESPYKEIYEKVFTLEQLMDVCAKYTGTFTYPEDWEGFNIPSNIYHRFYTLFKNNLNDFSVKENTLFESINKFIKKRKLLRFYLVGTYKDRTENSTIRHEIAHALFYLSKEYEKKMVELNSDFKLKYPKAYKKVKRALLNDGYSKHVIDDEIQAYFSEKRSNYFIGRYGIRISKKILKEYRRAFSKTFNNFT
jgi:hypothetical protein